MDANIKIKAQKALNLFGCQKGEKKKLVASTGI
jgi:hypothetical protein